MFNDYLLEEIKSQQARKTPGAVAMVVRREAPSSGKPGDAAVITAEGDVNGWIGGGCTKGIVIKEGLEAIATQSPRLVRIQADTSAPEQSGVKNYKMTCMSGGAVEVYIEPILPVSNIYIFGRSHIAKALCEIGKASGFTMHVISDLAEDEMFTPASTVQKLKDFQWEDNHHSAAVVCTQGEDDEVSLKRALEGRTSYLSFVSSRKKANAILMALKRDGIPHEDLIRVKTPAGLDIKAKTPQEVAISILAQIIEEKRSQEGKEIPEEEIAEFRKKL